MKPYFQCKLGRIGQISTLIRKDKDMSRMDIFNPPQGDTLLHRYMSIKEFECHKTNDVQHCDFFKAYLGIFLPNSALVIVNSSVPLSSVICPILFCMYIKPLLDSHSIKQHSFADDLQLQLSNLKKKSKLLCSMQYIIY